MAAMKNRKVLLKKLKKQVGVLERKEEKSHKQLRSAIKKMRKLGKSYKTKLNNKLQMMKDKIAKAQGSAYVKIALDIERKMLKSIDAKGKALVSAFAKIEKRYANKLTQTVAKKGKKVRKGKKARKLARAVSVNLPKKRGRGRPPKK